MLNLLKFCKFTNIFAVLGYNRNKENVFYINIMTRRRVYEKQKSA